MSTSAADNDAEEPKSARRERPYLGPAVDGGVLLYSSVSQIKLFREEDDGCKRKWVYRYPLRVKLAKTGALHAGIDAAGALEHYLTTGEDTLPDVLRAVKEFLPSPRNSRGELDLQCEQPLGDMAKALAARKAMLKAPTQQVRDLFAAEVRKFAGLVAGDIPIDGAADCRHTRGEYVDSMGQLRREDPRTRVAEIGDLKLVGQIFPRTILKGPNAGSVVSAYTKTDAQVCEDVQMVAYGRHAMDLHPDATHARLGHWYQNKNKKAEAVKRHGLVSREQLYERWDGKYALVVADMAQHAGATRIQDVEPNVKACDSFTHVDPQNPTGKPLKGCGYRYTCPLSTTQFGLSMISPYQEKAMSLFDSAPPPSPNASANGATPTPSVPPMTKEAYDAAVEAEKQKLLAQAAAQAAASYGVCAACGAQLSAQNASRLPTGAIVHIVGCAARQMQAPTPPTPPPIQVNPPDQPRTASLLVGAAPLPQSEIDRITDPELKAKVEQHAREHAEKAAAETARLEQEKIAAGTSAWCAVNKQKMLVDSVMSVNGYTCQCTKHWTLKALEPFQEGTDFFVVIPRHKPKNKAAQASAPTAPAPGAPSPGAQQVLPGVPQQAPSAPTSEAVAGWRIAGWSARDDLALKLGQKLLDMLDEYLDNRVAMIEDAKTFADGEDA